VARTWALPYRVLTAAPLAVRVPVLELPDELVPDPLPADDDGVDAAGAVAVWTAGAWG
jgi:hypothetical protein